MLETLAPLIRDLCCCFIVIYAVLASCTQLFLYRSRKDRRRF